MLEFQIMTPPSERRKTGHKPGATPSTHGGTTNAFEGLRPVPIQINELIPIGNLSFYQAVADGLTQAGLGTYSYAVAKQQVRPETGEPLSSGMLHVGVVVTYTGIEDRTKLVRVLEEVRDIKGRLERKGMSEGQVDQTVMRVVDDIIDLEPARDQAEKDASLARTLEPLAYDRRLLAVEYSIPGEAWRTSDVFRTADNLDNEVSDLWKSVVAYRVTRRQRLSYIE